MTLLLLFCLVLIVSIASIAMLLSKRNYRAVIGIPCFVTVIVGLIIFYGHIRPRTAIGRIFRWSSGEAGAQQIANDLAEDIRAKPMLKALQEWSVELLKRYMNGKAQTNGKASYWSVGTILLGESERPQFIVNEWGVADSFGEPEISVHLDSSNKPNSIVIAWYLYGVVIGNPEYKLDFSPDYFTEAKPGIYAYHLYK